MSQLRVPPHRSDSDMTTSLVSTDVFLLCFSISSLSSLYSATTNWIPALSVQCTDTPVIIVGCQSDRRLLSRDKKSAVSAERAVAFSQQCGAVMYVETSAKVSDRSSASAFEVAALTCKGEFSKESMKISNISMADKIHSKTRQRSTPRRDSSSSRSTGCHLNCLTPSPLYQSHPLTLGCKTASLSSVSLQSKSSTLSSTKSDSSVISISTTKTPLGTRRSGKKGKNDETVTIKCQRLNSHKVIEEVEIEVPANVYNNIQNSDSDCDLVRNSKERKSLGSKLKRLLLKD